MKKLSLLLIAAFVLLIVGVAKANENEVDKAGVDVYANINKDKDVTVIVDVTITKDVDINVESDIEAKGAAQSDSVLNQSNVENSVPLVEERKTNMANFRTAVIAGSVNDNEGIVQVNQDAGNMNNQANLTSIALVLGESDNFANAQAATGQVNANNIVYARGLAPAPPVQKVGLIWGSINDNLGIVGVNQSVGNMNNQANQVSLGIAEGSLVALSEAALGQSISGNRVHEVGTLKTDTITASINRNVGIVGVNQSGGNMNNQSNVVSFSGIVPNGL